MNNEDLLNEVGMTKERVDEVTRIVLKNLSEDGFWESLAGALDIKINEPTTTEESMEIIRNIIWEIFAEDDNFIEPGSDEIVAFTSLDLFEKEFGDLFTDDTLKKEFGLFTDDTHKIEGVTTVECLKWSYLQLNECLSDMGFI